MVAFGALAGLLAVIGGAVVSHALAQRLPAPRLATLGTAIDYQMYHALALLALGAMQGSSMANAWFARAAVCMTSGMLLFCGSLWVIGLSGWREAGVLAPTGGVLLMVGWGFVAAGAMQRERR